MITINSQVILRRFYLLRETIITRLSINIFINEFIIIKNVLLYETYYKLEIEFVNEDNETTVSTLKMKILIF